MSRYILAYEILLEFILGLFPHCFSKSPHTRIIVDHLIRNFPARIACYDMAAMLCISNRWLQKICAASFQITFTRLKRILRVYYALELFSGTNLDKYEIAKELHYSEWTNLLRDVRLELNVCVDELRHLLDCFSPQEVFNQLWKGL